MVSSSKKKRGKQRKAAKNASNSVVLVVKDPSGNGQTEVTKSRCIELIRMGSNTMTEFLSNPDVMNDIDFRKEIADGVVPVILGCLQRCEDETFGGVIASLSSKSTLETPSLWIKALSMLYELESSCRVQIIQNIGQLVKCMCNDTARLFFKSNKHWIESITPFVKFICNILQQTNDSDDDTSKIFDIILQQDSLLASIIQWGFWDEYRPDITKLLETNECTEIVDIGRRLAGSLIMLVNKKEAITIGTTSIISKQHDPNCTISYVEGLMLTLKVTNDMKYLRTAEELIVVTNLVDKGVITEILGFGVNYFVDYDSAELVSNMSAAFLDGTIGTNENPSDTRAAFAIRSGLFDMCFGYIKRFGSVRQSEFQHMGPLFDIIRDIFSIVHEVSLQKKSRKAIRHKKGDIEEMLVLLEDGTSVTGKAKCKELVDMVRCIIDLNGSYCCRCNKSFGNKTDVKQCNGCGCMTYCSEACQKKDWLNGHKLACCKTYTDETAGQFQGRIQPLEVPENERIAESLKNVEINITTIQLKLFLDNSEAILHQARSLDIPLCDCVVLFNLRPCPVKVECKLYTDVYNTPEVRKGFTDTRSRENITCIYTGSFNGGKDQDINASMIDMQRFFPYSWLYFGTDTIDTSNDTTSKRRVVKASSRWKSANKKA